MDLAYVKKVISLGNCLMWNSLMLANSQTITSICILDSDIFTDKKSLLLSLLDTEVVKYDSS